MSNSVSLEYLNNQLATKINLTQTSLSAQNTAGSTILVLLGGTAVPLATLSYNSEFAANGARTQFTAATAGSYLIQYSVNTTASLLLSAGVYKNGTAIPNLTRTPGISGTTFAASSIVTIAAGDVLQLTLFGLAGTAVLQGGAGAFMNIIRIA